MPSALIICQNCTKHPTLNETYQTTLLLETFDVFNSLAIVQLYTLPCQLPNTCPNMPCFLSISSNSSCHISQTSLDICHCFDLADAGIMHVTMICYFE